MRYKVLLLSSRSDVGGRCESRDRRQSRPLMQQFSGCRDLLPLGEHRLRSTHPIHDLHRVSTAWVADRPVIPTVSLWGAVLVVKYPAPVKPEAPVVFVPDLRSAEEKLRDGRSPRTNPSYGHP